MRSAMAGSNSGTFRSRRSLEHASQPHDFVQDPLRHFTLAQFWQGEVAAVAREKSDDIGVLVEARAFRGDVVGHDQISVFR